MPTVGYHASHEQFSPSELLAYTTAAERAGFTAAMSSDHLEPWLPGQRGTGFAYAWLGAAMQATALPFGVVTAPGQRYHPVVVAQAAATLEEMFPGRFWLALGSGELVNEHVTGDPWPSKATRLARLRECADVIRALWRGERVDHDGLVTVREARVHTTFERSPPLIAAAVTADTARLAAAWADGLVTVSGALLRGTVDAYREGGGTGPVYVQHHLSWAPSDEQAEAYAWEQWRQSAVGHPVCMELATPELIETAASRVRPGELRDSVAIGADPARHADLIAGILDAGAEQVLLHQVGPNQREFIDVFGAQVLPRLGVDGRA